MQLQSVASLPLVVGSLNSEDFPRLYGMRGVARLRQIRVVYVAAEVAHIQPV